MKIALIGATGNAGTRILDEVVRRGHEVTAIARHPEKVTAREGVTAARGDINDLAGLVPLLKGHDIVVSAIPFDAVDPGGVLDATKQAGVSRLLVVGGAASLEIAPGVELLDAPDFPAAYRAGAVAARNVLLVLREEDELNWTYFSPSAEFAPGERTGQFRLATDQLLRAENGHSAISMEDAAIALADEIERPRYPRQRFTAGY